MTWRLASCLVCSLCAAFATLPATPLLARQIPLDSAQTDTARARAGTARAATAEIVTVRIEQAVQMDSSLRVFLLAHDRAGEAVQRDIGTGEIDAFLASSRLPVDTVRPLRADDGTAFLIMIDVSRSVTARQFEQMKDAIAALRRRLGSADRAALLTFGSEVRLVTDFSADSAAFLEALSAVQRTDDITRFHEALTRSLEIARQRGTGMPQRRVIVTLTDGMDDVVGGVTREEVLHALGNGPVPVYGIGFAPPPFSPAARAGLQSLGEFARISGGRYIDGSVLPFDSLFARVHAHVNAAQVVDLDCSSCPADGNVYRLTLDVRDGTRRLSDGVDIRLFPRAVADAGAGNAASVPLRRAWPGAAAGVLLLAVLGVVWVRRRSRRQEVSVAAAPAGAVQAAGASAPAGAAQAAGAAAPAGAAQAADAAAPAGAVRAAGAAAPPVATAPAPAGAASSTAAALAAATVAGTRPLAEPPRAAAAARQLKIRLTALGPGGSAKTRVFSLRDRTTLGREPERAQVALRDEASVSAVHCALSRQGEALFIEDLGSTNGTFVNGVEVRGRLRIHNEDVIRLGDFEMRLRILNEPA